MSPDVKSRSARWAAGLALCLILIAAIGQTLPGPGASQDQPPAGGRPGGEAAERSPVQQTEHPAQGDVANSDEADDAILAQAMQRFVVALRDRDLRALLDAFPRSGMWYYVGTVPRNRAGKEKPSRSGLTFAYVKRGLRPRGDMVDFLFDGDDPFYLYVIQTKSRPWRKASPKTFVPPGEERDPPAHVRWRKEGGRYVIDEIGAPGS